MSMVGSGLAQETGAIKLPPSETAGGMPLTRASAEDKAFYSATDAGFIAQNVYLYCASAGLAVVVRSLVDRDALGAAMGLGRHQRIILAQSVGYPAGSAK
ncbi:nitroreductase family protein [Thiobacillus denitrificans]|uniref:nitroreductase family protein n=1 Tax=Thiobacillus denitrificans TaxID=36861 RepID=UPI001EDB81D1|nr:nitroreductase family protein [Thiobacillus denitrificans]